MKEQRVINTYDQNVADGGDRVVIFAYTQDSIHGAKFSIGKFKGGKMYVTDNNAAWYDNQRKTFPYYSRETKKQALAAAIAWVNEKYGPREFVRNRMGDYVEKEVNEKFPLPKRECAK